jgi:putative transcriptional regulator
VLESTAGKLLVATPNVRGAPFERSVVVVLEHDDAGAIGIVLNYPTDLPVVDHLPEIASHVSEPRVVFLGGPVQPDAAIALGRSPSGRFMTPSMFGDVGVVDVTDLPDDIGHLRIYAGYAGWSRGQLEDELAEGSWWVVPPPPGVLFAPATDALWQDAVAAAPGRTRLYATYPDDPSRN